MSIKLTPQNILRQTQNFNDIRYLIKDGTEQTVYSDVVFEGDVTMNGDVTQIEETVYVNPVTFEEDVTFEKDIIMDGTALIGVPGDLDVLKIEANKLTLQGDLILKDNAYVGVTSDTDLLQLLSSGSLVVRGSVNATSLILTNTVTAISTDGTLASNSDLNLSTEKAIKTYVDTEISGVDHGNLAGLSDDDHTQYLRVDASRSLTNHWNAGAFKITASRYESTVAIGSSPYACTSTTVNPNLNADLWDGYEFADYIDQAIKVASNPTFASLTLSGLTTGSVVFVGASGLLSQNNSSFYWDDSEVQLKLTDDDVWPYPQLLIQQDGTGDASMHIKLDGVTGFTVGVDNSDSDIFKINAGDFLDNVRHFAINLNGTVGINNIPLDEYRLNVFNEPTNSDGYGLGYMYCNSHTTVAGSYDTFGFNVITRHNGTENNSGIMHGLIVQTQNLSTSGTLDDLRGGYFAYGNVGSGAMVTAKAYGVFSQVLAYTGTITDAYDFYCAVPIQSGGTLTNEWAFYSDHIAPSRLVDDLQFDATNKGTVFGSSQSSSITDDDSDMLFDCDLNADTGRDFLFSNGNLSIINSTSGTDSLLQLQQDGSGDAAINIKLNGITGYTMGIDNSASDRFKLYAGDTIAHLNHFVMGSDGAIGLNAAPLTTFQINSFRQPVNTSGHGVENLFNNAYSTVNGTYESYGMNLLARHNGAADNGGTVYGLLMQAQNLGTGTLTNLRAGLFGYGSLAAGTTVNAVGCFAQVRYNAGTITNAYDFYCAIPSATGGTVTNEWAFYSDHEAKSRIVKDLLIEANDEGIVLGATLDSKISYDNTNMVFNPKLVGSGVLLADTDSKWCFRDIAIGMYSQADTYLDIFADGGVRIGDSSAGAPTNYVSFASNGDISFNGSAGFYPARIAQSAQPTPDTGELVMWRDTDDGKVYIVYNDTDSGVKKIELT